MAYQHLCTASILQQMEIIRICKDKEILREYLESREKEVFGIMIALFNDDRIQESFLNAERYNIRQEERAEAQKKVKAAEEKTKAAKEEAKAAKEEIKATKKAFSEKVVSNEVPVQGHARLVRVCYV